MARYPSKGMYQCNLLGIYHADHVCLGNLRTAIYVYDENVTGPLSTASNSIPETDCNAPASGEKKSISAQVPLYLLLVVFFGIEVLPYRRRKDVLVSFVPAAINYFGKCWIVVHTFQLFILGGHLR